MTDDFNPALYRPCVGLALFNRHGQVFMGERIPKKGEVLTHSWQMPQGGIDEGENPETAALRELAEEVGTNKARIVSQIDDWLYYDIPPAMALRLWKGKYKGQRQKWIALEFLGTDADIRLDAHSAPEFTGWKWVPIDEVVGMAVTFKREVYTRVVAEFAPFAEALRNKT